ncbi:hypothetical protein [Flammeovirga aprica]|uniref:TonB-dependent receptor plug domain-containing protein n=1 Tax=Flammeovirga aprica JL-4 TaxID=694437 RepID=A0A7X9P1Z7_9BACT|nr:hypothetical protein [Flammeovirga aprica]NME68066.1 hypothetical protein [Flammeovirga aprica JL-4]
MKLLRLIPFVLITVFALTGWEEVSSIDQLIKMINTNNRLKTNDAIYVHTDKPYYMAGENLWFKVYLRKASTLLGDQWSKAVHVELLSPSGEIVDEKKIYGKGDHSNGDFKLRTDLEEGRYRLRAYTSWMRNFGDSNFFNQEIQIYQINPDSLRVETPVLEAGTTNEQFLNRKQKYDLQFFPESGQFIENLSTKIGIKLVNQNGYGEKFSAKVYDQNDELITKVESNDLGMGNFFIHASNNNRYYAILDRDANEKSPKRYALPEAQKTGTTLFVVKRKDLYVKVISSNDELKEGGYLLASSDNKVLYSWKCPADKKLIPIKMPLADVNNGIIKLTLLNHKLEPIVERVVFHYTPQGVKLGLDRDAYKKREKVELSIDLKDENGDPLSGDASVAIVDQKLVDLSQKKNNIISQLILTNELKGNIENPSWYFENFDVKKEYALDDLMLTQGYRKINWIEDAKDSLDLKFIPEPGISLRGRTSNFWNEKKYQKSEITMTSLDRGLIHESVLTDDKGGFTFTGMVFFDSTNFIFQAKKFSDRRQKVTNNTSVKISIFELEPPLASPIGEKKAVLPKGNSLAQFEKEILNIEKIDRAFNTKTIILDEIEIVDEAELDDFQPSSKLHSNYTARYVTDSLAYAAGLSVWQFLQQEMRTSQVLRRSGLMAGSGATFEEDENGQTIVTSGGNQELPIVLDGFQVDIDMLQSMSMAEVGFIDVLDMTEGSIYTSNSLNGVIAIYTSQGGGGSYVVKGIDSIISPGFYTSRTFYQPKYDVQSDDHAKPDHRITLLWEPNITFDENGKANITFFTDDKATNYQVEIEGITTSGKPFYNTTSFTNN